LNDNQRRRYLRNAEIDELCEGLIREYAGSTYATQPVDIIGFATKYLKLRILMANINEADMSKLGFLSDGKTPISISKNGMTISHIFPVNTIVIDKVLCRESEKSRRLFTIAHEVFHYLEARLNGTETAAAFHSEFDREENYTAKELAMKFAYNECQADRGAAALLMPKALLENTLSQFNGNTPIAVYGRNLFTARDRTTLCNVADYLGVSLTALVIRMEHLNLFEKHAFCEYVSDGLHLN